MAYRPILYVHKIVQNYFLLYINYIKGLSYFVFYFILHFYIHILIYVYKMCY